MKPVGDLSFSRGIKTAFRQNEFIDIRKTLGELGHTERPVYGQKNLIWKSIKVKTFGELKTKMISYDRQVRNQFLFEQPK